VIGRFVSLTIVLFITAGCALAWGTSYKVELENSSSITINYDPSLTNITEVQNVAKVHCAEFHSDAISQGSEDRMWGLRNTSFLCKPRIELRRED
jgi:hypothetical protein